MKELCLKRNNRFLNLKKLRWLLSGCLIFLFVSSCRNVDAHQIKTFTTDPQAEQTRHKNAVDSINILSTLIKTGDLITRTGNDFTSESLRSFNRRSKKYSHCGIAIIENDSIFVYHALGGDFNPDQKLLREPFITFADPSSNVGVGLFRFNMNDSLKTKLSQIVHYNYNNGLQFDMKFDLDTDDKMYCAEFVAKSYSSASNYNLIFNKSKIEYFTFYGVDDIFLNPNCFAIKELTYKQ